MQESLFLTAQQVSQEARQLARELLNFRDRVLPRLVDANRPLADKFACAATVMADNADSLAWSVAGRQNPVHLDEWFDETVTWDQVEKAIQAAHAAQHPTAQMHLLRQRAVTDEELSACRWSGQRVVWSLCAMVRPWPVEVLDERSRLIAQWLKVEASSADELRRVLLDLPRRRLLRAFRRMPFDTFCQLAEALVRINPEVPDAVLLVPTGKYGPAASARASWDVPCLNGLTSYLLGTAMEIRANNHFGLVWRTALRPETLGNWRVFMPGQVLDILYRKWQVLHIMANQGADPHIIVLSQKRPGDTQDKAGETRF
jgi:hypothetical protein